MRWLGIVLIISILLCGCASVGGGKNTKVGGEVVLRGTYRDM